ncbi:MULTISPECIES: NAD(P)H-dependent oxidoreductase [Cobetia]|uniref:NAD(P)H-dependent oxidoreductase n=1 Tax=Cobetia crustatorum TaxID=553385 RepID=A0A558HLW2_9GAMM|nr:MULTISPECIES: NAD(P)H-dependent oxidoreductase [Cobetia]TVU70130.1 NAD(P)H-dependent oxidoreductase [Cobetia crustatorum]
MNILLINGGKAYAHSNGELNATLHELARGELAELGHTVKETVIEQGFEAKEEVEKQLWADLIIYQTPGWWMGLPWTVKKYLDDILTEGHGSLYASDGRHRTAPTQGYGTGGLMQGRQYMLSLTWNAPIEAFDETDNFFEGKGIDGVYFPVHKAMEFLGLTALPTYLANDVIKNPDLAAYTQTYRDHLREHVGHA